MERARNQRHLSCGAGCRVSDVHVENLRDVSGQVTNVKRRENVLGEENMKGWGFLWDKRYCERWRRCVWGSRWCKSVRIIVVMETMSKSVPMFSGEEGSVKKCGKVCQKEFSVEERGNVCE